MQGSQMRLRMLLVIAALTGWLWWAPSSVHAQSPSSEELMRADRAFAADTARRGAEGWASWFLPEGVMYRDQGKIVGREAILEAMQDVFGPGKPLLRWEPLRAELAASGELGWTFGSWKLVGDPGGREAILASGEYMTLWKQDADGDWRVAADMGNDDPTPPATDPVDAEPDWSDLRGPDRFPELDWLIGEWQGHGVFSNGNTTWLYRSYSYDVGGVFLDEHTMAVFPPDSLSTDFEAHQDRVLWYRDTKTGALKSTTFFVEGYVTTAAVKVEDGGRRYIVESSHIENAPPGLATRFTVQRTSEDEIEESFEMKFPGREWSEVETITLRRVHAGGSR